MSNDLNSLTADLREFVEARNWERFHAPKNLVMALSVEVAELLEHFQWLTNEESDALDAAKRSEVADEIADVQIYLLELADRLGIDVGEAVRLKMAKNAVKYPAG
ncbi:MAG: nucleotide pyrophosphohydrolase [Trueperaceae bacterium]|jgi:NTP pyrophosphatase (non-canonical NTP hydrolase)|nr:nucleotide pyrophosphohydrolase [Trueperaceae bacterium]HRQ10821.1 nucleotide pyrophosphohydrolase [Trueperaceae bacterium]